MYNMSKDSEKFYLNPDNDRNHAISELEAKLKLLDEQIAAKKRSIERATEDIKDIKKKTTEYSQKYKEQFGEQNKDQVVIENKCNNCFKSKNEKHYKTITFDHFSEILHQEIRHYLSWLNQKLEVWKPKAEKIIEEIITTIRTSFPNPDTSVILTGSYYTGYFVPWSNFNFSVNAVDLNGNKLKPEETMDVLVKEFSKKNELLSQIKTFKGPQVTALKLECKQEYDSRKIEIFFKEERSYYRQENIIKEYMKTYKYLEPLYFVLKKFLFNVGLCNNSESASSSPSQEGLFSYTLILMIVALFQSMKYQLKIPDTDIVQKFDSFGTLLISFFNIYGNQIDINQCDICPSMPNAEIVNPFNERVYDPLYIQQQPGLRVFDPEKKNFVIQHYKKSGKMKRILSYAYLYSMGCCDCLEWSTGSYLPSKEQMKKLLEEEKRDSGYIRYILPKLFCLQEQYFPS